MTPHAFTYDPVTNTAHPTAQSEGPWSPGFQHGGAPSALSVFAAEQLPTLAPMEVASVTVDLMRPVPLAPLEVEARVVREGKKLQLCAVDLLADGAVVSRARVLKLRRADLPVPGALTDRHTGIALPEAGEELDRANPNGFSSLWEMRGVSGGFAHSGPAQMWTRMTGAIVADQPVSPAMRVAAAADFGNGISSVLPFNQWLFLNADLSITLSRLPVDEWVLLDSRTEVDATGRGITFTRIGDQRGWIGHATQTLLVEKR